MAPLLDQLQQFKHRVRRALVVERFAQVLAAATATVVAAVILDSALKLPTAVRVAELLIMCAAAAFWLWRRVLPAVRFDPPLVEVALRLERDHAEAEGVLASGADFARAGDVGSLAQETVRAATAVAPRLTRGRVDAGPARRALLGAVIAGAFLAGMAWIAPDTTTIGLQRLFTPFAGVQWPARTMVESGMLARVHPRGAALALRAVPVRGDAQSMRVSAEYRLLVNGAGEWRTVLLSLQPDGSFERLVETDGQAVEIVFHTSDMETEPVRVALVEPPRVIDAQVSIAPPKYAESSVDARRADLGPGTDRRAVLSPPVLAGSQVELALHMEGATAPPAAGSERDEFVKRTFKLADASGAELTLELQVDAADASRWKVVWRASGPGVLELTPAGAEGILPAMRIAYEVPSVADQPPTISVTEPASDETLTPEATPLVVAEGRDDLRVARVWMDVVRAARRTGPPPRAGEGAAPAVAATAPGDKVATFNGEPGIAARVEATLPLKQYSLQPGDSVVLTAYAVDGFESDGTPRAPVASTPRVLRIIGVAELAEQVRSRLGQLREAAGRLREEQHSIREAAEQAAETTQREGAQATATQRAQLAGTQGRLADRIGAFERALAELGGRLDRNATDGGGLKDAVNQAKSQAQQAAQAAQKASAALPQESGAQEGAQRAGEAERALAELENALERDRVSAQFARRIDELAERVARAQAETRAMQQRTVGRKAEDVSPADRAALEQTAQAQREAAAEARSLSEQLETAASEAERGPKPEPGAAQAMRQAAREAEERGLSRQLEQGAQETQKNQLQAAQEAQQKAQEAIGAMRQAMRDQQRARNEDLRRRIASLVESLRSLLGGIEAQAMALQAMPQAEAGAADAVTRAVLALSRNAVSIAQEAVAAGAQTQRVAELVERAGTQLDATAVKLRATPIDLPGANEQVELARRSVQEALASAQAIERRSQREAENRRRAELKDLYTQVLERQRSARASTEAMLPAPGQPMSRRTLVESRRIAAEQSAVTGLLQNLGERPDVSGSELFSAAQEEMLDTSRQASADLSTSVLSRRTVLLQAQVERQIAALVEALTDPEQPEDPFARQPEQQQQQQQQQQGEGNAMQGQKMPPIAELKLLRTMAQQALDDTRAAAEVQEDQRGAFLERISRRQRRLLELGESWMERMKRESAPREQGGAPADEPGGDAVPGDRKQPAEPAPGFGWQAPPASKPASPPPAPPPPPALPPANAPSTGAAKPASPPPEEPSLDDALGLEKRTGKSDDSAARQKELERSLRQEKPRDLLGSALDDLRRSTDLLADREPGLSTQRLQESTVRKLDELIATARRMQQQQNQQQSQQDKQQQQQQQGEKQSQAEPQQGQNPQDRGKENEQGDRNKRAGDPKDAGTQEPPPSTDPTRDLAQLDESRTAWGQLPARVRDAVRQGMRDPMSAAYRKLTQDYYRRMAEEPRR